MKKKLLISLFLAVVLAGAGADTFVLGTLKGPSGVGLAPMIVEPVTLDNGIPVEVVALGAPDVMVSRIINREVDAAVLPVNLAAKLYNAGQPIRLAAIVGNGMLSLVSRDTEVGNLADLGGDGVYVAGQGSTPEFVFRFLLDKAELSGVQDRSSGLASTEVGLNFSMPYPEITASIIAGRIDHAVLPEPFATMAVLRGQGNVRKAVDLQALWARVPGNEADYPMTALVVRRDVVEDEPETLDLVLEAYRESLETVLADPQAAGPVVERSGLGLQAPVAAQAIPVTNYVYIPAVESRQKVEGLLRVFLDFAPPSIGGKLPDDGFYLR